MKRIGIICAFIVVFSSLTITNLRAQSNQFEEHIQDLNVRVTVEKDGSIQVHEQIDYDFGSYSRHGIYRDIPVIKTNRDGKRYKMDISQISVTDEQGREYRYKKSKNSDGEMSLRIGDPDKTITGLHRYNVSYSVFGALTYFSDHDELYWNAIGTKWNVPIERSHVEIEIPQVISGNELKIACYTGVITSTASDCSYDTQEKDGRTMVNYASTRELGSGEGLTVVVGFPRGIVAVREPTAFIPFNETWYGKILITLAQMLVVLVALLWYVIYPIWIVVKWFRYGRDPKQSQLGEVQGSVRAWFDPPKGKKGRLLTPAETGSIIDEQVDIRDLVASLIDLARRGYMKIDERKKGDFYLIKKKEFNTDTSLQPFEKELLSGIFAALGEVRLKDTHMVTTIEKVRNHIYTQLVTEGYFPKNPQSIRTFYAIISVLSLISFNFILFLISLLFGRAMPIKTVKGVEASLVSKSLKNFLSSQERQLAFQADKQLMFEKLLPYAVAFGVEKIWAKRFEDISLKDPEWYSSYGSTRFNSYVLANNIHSSFVGSVTRSVTPTSSSSGFSSGFSGGSSGGGGGGGGGGSW